MPGMAEPGRIAGETLGRFLDPMSLALVGGSQVGETIRRLTEGPRFADLGADRAAHGQVMELWLQVQQAARAYEAVVAGAWTEASRRFAKEFQERYRAGTGADPAQGGAQAVAGRSPTGPCSRRTARSGSSHAQGELLRQGMDFLLAEREMVEALVEPAGLPTRTEIDEVHRSVQELKRRVRALGEGERCGRADAAAGSAPSARRTQASSDGRSPGMIPMPTAGPAELMRAAAAFNTKVAAGVTKLSTIKDEQVQIATTPKDEVFRTDKVTLYRYRPLGRSGRSRPRS